MNAPWGQDHDGPVVVRTPYGPVTLLERDEQDRLARLAGRGDRKSRDLLIRSFIPLAMARAKDSPKVGTSFDDLMSEAMEGLIDAVDRIDPAKVNGFVTYALAYITQRLHEHSMRSRSLVMVKATPSQRCVFMNLGKAKRALRVHVPSPITWSDACRLSVILNASPTDVQEMDIRMNMPSPQEDALDAPDVIDLNPLLFNRDLHEEIAAGITQERIEAVLKRIAPILSPRERQILDERMLADDPMTLEAFAVRNGISRERVRQLEASIMTRIGSAVTAVDPMLAREFGARPGLPIDRTRHPRVLESSIRKHRRLGRIITGCFVTDAEGETVARYPWTKGRTPDSRHFLEGHAHGATLPGIDPRGLALVTKDGRCRILHHGEEIMTQGDEAAARAWLDGLRAGLEDVTPFQGSGRRNWPTIPHRIEQEMREAPRHQTMREDARRRKPARNRSMGTVIAFRRFETRRTAGRNPS